MWTSLPTKKVFHYLNNLFIESIVTKRIQMTVCGGGSRVPCCAQASQLQAATAASSVAAIRAARAEQLASGLVPVAAAVQEVRSAHGQLRAAVKHLGTGTSSTGTGGSGSGDFGDGLAKDLARQLAAAVASQAAASEAKHAALVGQLRDACRQAQVSTEEGVVEC